MAAYDDLYHYGTTGMKWRNRLYQYEDGTYTELGKLRRRQDYKKTDQYQKDKKIRNERFSRAFEQKKIAKDKPPISPAEQIGKNAGDIAYRVGNIVSRNNRRPKEDLSQYSDNDLRSMVNRMQLEQQYSNLKSNNIQTGAEKVKDAIDTIGDVLAIGTTALGLYALYKQIKG